MTTSAGRRGVLACAAIVLVGWASAGCASTVEGRAVRGANASPVDVRPLMFANAAKR